MVDCDYVLLQLTMRRTTGIPSEELMVTTSDDPQAYLHPSGKYVVPIMHWYVVTFLKVFLCFIGKRVNWAKKKRDHLVKKNHNLH
jgi:hypothetical protein